MHVALISLEDWDSVWRRNQHIAANLVRHGLVESLTFVEPPRLRGPESPGREPVPGLRVFRPALRLPKRLGGLVEAAHRLTRAVPADVLWINEPSFGVHCLRPGVGSVYDVTDDWREFDFPSRIKRRLVRAEDRLAVAARTVVCSEVLRDRWQTRYGAAATVINNAVDVAAWERAEPVELPGPGPHVGYVGTLHAERLDLDLLLRVAAMPHVGTMHLVGPDALDSASRKALKAQHKVVMHGAVPSAVVPGWTKAMDVLVSPHRITAFTMSLDAIKSYEYLASGRPIVATPTSGFQLLSAEGLHVVPEGAFAAAVVSSLASAASAIPRTAPDWSDRARDFAAVLAAVDLGRTGSGRERLKPS